MIQKSAATPAGKKRKLDQFVALMGQHLNDVVVAAWLPDSLIKDMTYGHVFKTSKYAGDQATRFTLGRAALKKRLAPAAFQRDAFLDALPAAWWDVPYRVKDNGGHLPNRVTALAQGARDMLRMGDDEVYGLGGIADAHMPFHCDNRKLASTSSAKNAHGKLEDLWGEQVPALFKANTVLNSTAEQILAEPVPASSHFKNVGFGDEIPPLANGDDPWKEAVYTCRASFAVSFSLVPADVAAVDDQGKQVSRDDILANNGFCGEDRFWKLSQAIMHDAATSIAMFWQDVWVDFSA